MAANLHMYFSYLCLFTNISHMHIEIELILRREEQEDDSGKVNRAFWEVWRLAFVKTEDWKTLKVFNVKTEDFKIA